MLTGFTKMQQTKQYDFLSSLPIDVLFAVHNFLGYFECSGLTFSNRLHLCALIKHQEKDGLIRDNNNDGKLSHPLQHRCLLFHPFCLKRALSYSSLIEGNNEQSHIINLLSSWLSLLRVDKLSVVMYFPFVHALSIPEIKKKVMVLNQREEP